MCIYKTLRSNWYLNSNELLDIQTLCSILQFEITPYNFLFMIKQYSITSSNDEFYSKLDLFIHKNFVQIDTEFAEEIFSK